jgi:hypothetical protein
MWIDDTLPRSNNYNRGKYAAGHQAQWMLFYPLIEIESDSLLKENQHQIELKQFYLQANGL